MQVAGVFSKWALPMSACLTIACAREGRHPRTPPPGDPPAEASVAVPRTLVTPDEAIGVDQLYARAERESARGDTQRAAKDFERVARSMVDEPLAPRAWLRASEAHEQLGELTAAITCLEQLVRRHSDHALAGEALVRLIRLYAHLEQWQRAGWAASRLLPVVEELSPIHQVVVYGGKGLALVFAGDPDAAQYYVEKGRNVVDAYQLDRAGRLPRDLAQLYFALGEIRRARAERIGFVPPPPSFPVALERRCQLLLDAQSAYSDAMRAYDAHWSTMAGFRVGELYQSLHEDLTSIPPPATADTPERRLLFEGAMRLRYAVLLEKARAMLDHTLAMAERTDERSRWVERTRAARATIDHAIARESSVIDSLPYSRAELQAALDQLSERAHERQ